MSTEKFSQFTNGGDLSPTDQIVGLRSGANYRFSAPSGQLLAINNLSDVADPVISLSNIDGQPKNLVGSGDPNGVVDGVAGISSYFDMSTTHMWRCTVTGTVWVDTTVSSAALPANIIYFSALIGNDSTGNGSESYPFATYQVAAAYAATLATVDNEYAVYPMGNETVVGDIVLYPYVGFSGSNISTNTVTTTAKVVLHASWATADSRLTSCNVSIDAAAGFDLLFTADKQAVLIFQNTSFLGTPTFKVKSNGFPSFQICVLQDCIGIGQSPTFTAENVVFVNFGSATSGITSINSTDQNQSLLINLSTSILLNGGLTIRTVAPGTSSLCYGSNTIIDSLTLDGVGSGFICDVISYPASITYLNGTSISDIQLNTSSSGLLVPHTPVNYSLPVATAYPQNSATNHISGIDNAIGGLGNPNSYPQIAYVNSVTGNDSSTNGNIQSPFLTYDAAVLFLLSFSPTATNRCAVILTGDFTFTDLNYYPFIDVYPLEGATLNVDNVYNSGYWDLSPNTDIVVGPVRINSPNFVPSFATSQNAKQYYIGTDFTGCPSISFSGSGITNPEQIYLTNCVSKNNVNYLFTNLSAKVTNCDTVNVTLTNTSTLALDVKCVGILPPLDTGEGLLLRVNDSTGSATLTSIGCDPTSVEVEGTTSRWATDAGSYITPDFAGGANKDSVSLITLSDSIIANENYTPINYTIDNSDPNYQGDSVTGNLKGIDNKIGELVSDLDTPTSYSVRFTSGQAPPLSLGYQVVPLSVSTATGADFSVDVTNGTVTYTGVNPKRFSVTYIMSVDGSVATNIGFAIGINGTRDLDSEQLQAVSGAGRTTVVPLNWTYTLSTNDFINLTAIPTVANTLQFLRGGLTIHSV